GDHDTHEADLADALDQLMRRAHTHTATPGEQRLITRTAPLKTPPTDGRHDDGRHDPPDVTQQAHGEDEPGDEVDASVPYTGLGLYDPAQEALNW
ncbi:hypothetical protein RKD20_009364, partial [Streptomyces sp. SLBN-8D4]